MNPFQKKKNKISSGLAKNKFWLTGFFNALLLLVNFLVVAALFFAESACWISPVKFLLPSYFGLGFPVILLLTVLFLIFWIIRRKWYFVVSLTALLVSYQSVFNTFPLNKNHEVPENSIKVLSYNVHLFNFYVPETKNKIIDYLVDSGADIICLQEFGYSDEFQSEILGTLSKKYPYHHLELTHTKNRKSHGIATFSKFPILQKVRIPFDSKYNLAVYSDVRIHNRKVRVFNCHLESNRLTENDKELIKNLGEEYKNDRINEVVDQLSQKLGRSYKKRAKQAELVSEEIAKTDFPVIVCGDFNDVPVSYVYTKIKGNRLSDAFEKSGNGYGHTFREKMFWFRIDYIMYGDDFSAFRFNVDKVDYSDHFPVKCYLKLKD
ncbi:MAG: endonuclease/exonuclease/phosphatase family protein [Prevotellaceae bacterium]|jgi:endonuclease/exonuclease/phosphatase family metal-dependent hydrolase|nr:endonuclease/exonuclease/phosphatase family protein [Prevotellaceae bacterium]